MTHRESSPSQTCSKWKFRRLPGIIPAPEHAVSSSSEGPKARLMQNKTAEKTQPFCFAALCLTGKFIQTPLLPLRSHHLLPVHQIACLPFPRLLPLPYVRLHPFA